MLFSLSFLCALKFARYILNTNKTAFQNISNIKIAPLEKKVEGGNVGYIGLFLP